MRRAAEVSLSGALLRKAHWAFRQGSDPLRATDRPPEQAIPHAGELGGIFSDVHAAGK